MVRARSDVRQLLQAINPPNSGATCAVGAGIHGGYVDYQRSIVDYLNSIAQVLQALDVAQIEAYLQVLADARSRGKTIYVFGNGGSGATASHMVCDLNKGARSQEGHFRVVCLNDNVATLLAYANDGGYETVFVEQLKNYLEPGDVVIGISGSGNSENVIRAIDYANEHGALTVGLCGYSGGRLKHRCKVVVHVPIDDMQKAEDVHFVLGHLAMQILTE